MADYQTINPAGTTAQGVNIDAGLRAHMNKVYGQMSVALAVSGGVAWAVGTTPAIYSVLVGSPLIWVFLIAYLIMGFTLPRMIMSLSQPAAQLAFYVFAALLGVVLSGIFIRYTQTSIASTFFVTAAAFAGLSLYGYTTKRDLSPIGAFLVMGMIGLFIAMIVNFFLQSSGLDFAISAIGVLIFAGMTAWDTQKIKVIYLEHAQNGDADWLGKATIMGAFQLFMDFINLFLFLLRFMGNNRN